MTAIDAIRLSTMLVLSALLAVLVIAGLFSSAEHAAGVAHVTPHRGSELRRVVGVARAGGAGSQALGRRQAQRRTGGVTRGQPPRPVRNGSHGRSPRN